MIAGDEVLRVHTARH